MVTGDQPDVSAADDEQLFSWTNEVAIDQGLKCACAVHSGQSIAFESQKFFTCTTGHQNNFGCDQSVSYAIMQNPNLLIAEDSQTGGLGPDLDRTVLV